jgi:tRNA modification GTPase
LCLDEEISRYLDDARCGERLRCGIHIAIIGPPNAGKSSLLNALARRDVAIVSETAGTTRDVIEVHLDLAGYPVVLADTAGLREAADDRDPQGAIEAEGVRRARAGAAAADLRLAVFDLSAAGPPDAATVALLNRDSLAVFNKCDLVPEAKRAAIPALPHEVAALAISVRSGAGLDELMRRLRAEVARRLEHGSAVPAITRLRHRRALEDTTAALRRARRAMSPELIAEDLRMAARALGRIAGRVDVEEVLDSIFREFCIGK